MPEISSPYEINALSLWALTVDEVRRLPGLADRRSKSHGKVHDLAARHFAAISRSVALKSGLTRVKTQ